MNGGRTAAPRTKAIIWVTVFAGVLTILLANAHLLYVAATSQSDCVEHVIGGDVGPTGRYSAAKSAC
jgi:hypothetical protein